METGDILELLQVCANHEAYDILMWSEDFEFWVLCNDLMVRAADAVPVCSRDDIARLEKSLQDAGPYGGMLYCCRTTGLRPLSNLKIPEEYHPLFDACGPER